MSYQKLKNIIIGNQFIGLDVFAEADFEKVNCIFVKKNKNELSITDSIKFNSIDEIKDDNIGGIPIILTLNTDKVLTKEVDSIDKNDSVLVKKAFPNINLDEFYYQIWRLSDNSNISIVRKTYLNETISLFKDNKKININSVFIGISPLENVINYINNDSVLLNGKIFDKISNSISSSNSDDSINYDVNNIQIKNTDLLSFSSIISYLSNNSIGSINELNLVLKNNYFQNSFFIKSSRFLTYSLLAILLINFIFFNYYFNKFNEINILSDQNNINVTNIESLKKSIIEKETKLKEYAVPNTEKASVMINEIIESIPTSILLNEVQFQPIEKKGNIENSTTYFNNVILISGKTISNDEFTEWIDYISKIKKYNKVTIINFGKDENRDLIFTIKIELNETK